MTCVFQLSCVSASYSSRLALGKTESHQTLMKATVRLLIYWFTSLSLHWFPVLGLQRGLQRADAQWTSVSWSKLKFCTFQKYTVTQSERNKLVDYIDSIAAKCSPVRTCLKGKLFATKAFCQFPAESLYGQTGLLYMSQCRFLIHNVPWEYIYHVQRLLLNLRRKRQVWKHISNWQSETQRTD